MRLLRTIPTLSFHSLTLTLVLLLPHGTHALWPQPRSLNSGQSALRLAPSFTITVAVPNAPADLLAAVERTRWRLATDKLARLDPSRGAADRPAVSSANALPALVLRLEGDGAPEQPVKPIAEEATAPLGTREERYSLGVPDDGNQAVLSAPTTLGLFRGLNTFAQLWYSCDGGIDGDGSTVYMLTAPVMIQDWPAYVRSFVRCFSWCDHG
jgi:hexosaminidase